MLSTIVQVNFDVKFYLWNKVRTIFLKVAWVTDSGHFHVSLLRKNPTYYQPVAILMAKFSTYAESIKMVTSFREKETSTAEDAGLVGDKENFCIRANRNFLRKEKLDQL